MSETSAQAARAASGDPILDRLTGYAAGLEYGTLDPETVHAIKVRIIDTLGALIGGFHGEPCELARKLAASVPMKNGASIIGTKMKTAPDLAAFVNGTTAREAEMNDIYHVPGRAGGHPSDVILPTFAAAEYGHANGREFITGVALAYEIYLRMTDAVELTNFDYTNLVCLGTAVGAGKLLGLTREQLAHCIAMAVVPNNALLQGRKGHLSMWKVMATGQAGRAAVFAALLAREGAKGPSLPFVGQAGWCKHISGKDFSLDEMGGCGVPFRVHHTLIKPRPARYVTIPGILAAEKIAPLGKPSDVKEVVIETFRRAAKGTDEAHWSPGSRETADHSLPYVVAAALLDGTVSHHSFDDARLQDPALRTLLGKMKIVENPEFTRAHEQSAQHRTRVTVLRGDGSQATGESGGPHGDLSDLPSDAQVEEKFRSLAGEALGTTRAQSILGALWNLDRLDDVGSIPASLVI